MKDLFILPPNIYADFQYPPVGISPRIMALALLSTVHKMLCTLHNLQVGQDHQRRTSQNRAHNHYNRCPSCGQYDVHRSIPVRWKRKGTLVRCKDNPSRFARCCITCDRITLARNIVEQSRGKLKPLTTGFEPARKSGAGLFTVIR